MITIPELHKKTCLGKPLHLLSLYRYLLKPKNIQKLPDAIRNSEVHCSETFLESLWVSEILKTL